MNELASNKLQSRIGYMDVVKYLTMFSVIYVHCIQYSNLDDYNAWSAHPAFVTILSFNMPLFMIISGFFFQSCLKRSFKELVWGKIRQLLIPAIIWATISYFSLGGSFVKLAGDIWIFGWFVKFLFLCYLVTWMLYKLPLKRFSGGVNCL